MKVAPLSVSRSEIASSDACGLSALSKVPAMDTWPFSVILPKDFGDLNEQEEALLHSITAGFLAFVPEQRTDDEDPTDHTH